MASKFKKIRISRFRDQNGQCCYCECEMWEGQPTERHKALGPEGMWFQATAEHLTAQRDGGSHGPDNILVACLRCNRRRHQMKLPLTPFAFRQFVAAQLRKGRWHLTAPHR